VFYAGLMWVSRLSVMFAAYYPFVWFKSVDFDNPLGSIIDLVITHWLSRSPCLYVMSHTVSRLVPLPSTSGPQLNTVSCHRIAVPFLMAAEYLFAEYYFVDLDYRPLATHIHPILSICTRSFCVSGMSSQESECHDCDKHQQHQHPWTLMDPHLESHRCRPKMCKFDKLEFGQMSSIHLKYPTYMISQ